MSKKLTNLYVFKHLSKLDETIFSKLPKLPKIPNFLYDEELETKEVLVPYSNKTTNKQHKYNSENLPNTVINANNLIIGNNYGNQSSKKNLYKPTIENDIKNPINKDTKIWSISHIVFAISMGLAVSVITYIVLKLS